MLVIRYINPTGMFSYGRSENIDLQQRGLVNLLGENEDTGGDSNGAGKSSIFNALCEILYGENPTGVNGNGVVNQVWKFGFAGRVEFVSWEGVYYRVTYCRDWKDSEMYPSDNDNQTVYKGTELFLDKFVDGSWRDARGSKMSETRRILLDALGVSYERFLATSYLSHRIGSRFLRGTNKERLDILTGVTGIEEWDRVLLRCREERKVLQGSVQADQENIAYLQGTLGQIEESLKNLNQTDWEEQERVYLEFRDQKRKEAATWMKEIKEKEDQIYRLSGVQKYQYENNGIGVLAQEIADLEVEERSMRSQSSLERGLPSFDPILNQKVIDVKSKVDQYKGKLQAFLRNGDFRNLDECPTCGAKITKLKKRQIDTHIVKLERNILDLESEYSKLLCEQREKETQVQNARTAAYRERQDRGVEISKLIREKQIQMQKSSLEYEQIVQQIQSFSNEVARMKNQVASAVKEAEQYEEWVKTSRNNLRMISDLATNLRNTKNSIRSIQKKIKSVVSEIEILGWLIQHIPYIKLHKLSVSLGTLSGQINKYLSEMGETVRMNLSAFDEKKSVKEAGDLKDLLKSEVSVEVVDGEKNIDPRLYSDGETSKLSNALIRALHDMAVQNGQGCNLILLDEIFAFVDQSNSGKLVDSFSSIPAGTVLITDNSGHVNDLLNFNESWVARKKNGITTLGVSR